MRTLASALLLTVALPASGQDRAVEAPTLALTLNRPQTQWVFNHVCVPAKLLEGQGFTRGQFVEAYLFVSRLRWEAALEALSPPRQSEQESMKSLAPILHGMIDAYWPGRVERDSDGAITQFRDCDELGNLQGILAAERTGGGPNEAVKEQVTRLVSQVTRKWKERRPFSEVMPILQGGPMKIDPGAASQPLTAK